jgi:hypothetical protein
MMGRLVTGLPSYLRHPITLDAARATLQSRLAGRITDFLALVRDGVYGSATSPYRALLGQAGCEYGDLEGLVRRDGIEDALQAVARAGVYLTVDELKGRCPVVRAGTSFVVGPDDLVNPRSRAAVPGRTSGSRGARARIPIDLGFIRDRAVNTGLAIDAWGGCSWTQATWEIPGGSALGRILWLSRFGNRPVRWFSQVDPASTGLDARYRWSMRAVRWLSVLARSPLPAPEFVPLATPLAIAEWMQTELAAGRIPLLHTFPSSAVRLCRAAAEAGIELPGARFAVVGEPVTPARVAAVRRVGADLIAVYGSAEAGRIGYGCPRPDAPDDVHVMHDLVALIQPSGGAVGQAMPASALLVTSLRPSAPIVLLNASLGDEGELVPRACGCAMEALGWSTHLRHVRSYEKLTAGGMTFLDRDVVRVLEETLPARFGGGPTDYQLLEEEGESGQSRVRLLVHPAVGPVDTAAVAEVFLDLIGRDGGASRVMALHWRGAGLLSVERRIPLVTGPGKILHLAAARSSRAPSGRG